MKLIVHEIQADGVTQVLTSEKNTIVEAVRAHVYRHNQPSGSLQMLILDESDTTVAVSDPVDLSAIGSQAFFHGYVRFDVHAGLKKNTAYKFKLIGSDGYEFSESAYAGWCNGFDLGKYASEEAALANPLKHPLDLEIWERKTR